MKSDQKRHVTLEDLLRLKRAERPPAEFWPQFERELRAKQLAAIVARRPWWREFPRQIFSNFARFHLPLGATAVLALTFISVRQYHPAENDRALGASLNAISATSIDSVPSADRDVPVLSAEVDLPASSERVTAALRDDSSTEVPAAAPVVLAVAQSPVLTGNVSAMNALLGVSSPTSRDASIASPSAELPGVNLASVQPMETPISPSTFSEKRGFESRVLPARTVEPLANVTPPDRVRRSRYLGTSLPATMPVSTASNRSSERVISRISDERLYDTASRYGFGGDRLGFKF